MIIEFKKILIEGKYLTISLHNGKVSTVDISASKSKDKLISGILSEYDSKATFKSLVIKDRTIIANLYLNKEAVIKYIEFNSYKTELNNIIKTAFKKLNIENDTK
jgi:hypothetical protein